MPTAYLRKKIRPVKESIDKVEKAMEKGMDKMDDKFEIMLKALSRIEDALMHRNVDEMMNNDYNNRCFNWTIYN